jgi:predicted ATP-dependent endonuclease of OLD family
LSGNSLSQARYPLYIEESIRVSGSAPLNETPRMKLVEARITKYRSIDDSGTVPLDDAVTVLVGQNESGKTAFLQALNKARSTETEIEYSVTDDYPRKDLLDYEEVHEEDPATVAVLAYRLEPDDVAAINTDIGHAVVSEQTTFKLNHHYGNNFTITSSYQEKAVTQYLISTLPLTEEHRSNVGDAATVKALLEGLEKLDMNEAEKTAADTLKSKYSGHSNWHSPLSHRIWTKHLSPKVPKFLYLDDYRLLPGKANLPDIQRRVQDKQLREEDKAVLRLLELAKVDLSDLMAPGGYERHRARLEGTSSNLSRRIFKYWKSNTNLRVLIDVADDPNDSPPFNSGKNLYLRIHNTRHDVSVPFDQRSKGFIWFFSFLTWFGSAKLNDDGRPIVLLLDEPGLNLHALAQADILRYIDDLSSEHQVIYTTHSPFMVESNRLYRVRTVEDREESGTVVSDSVSGSDAKTLFPLQAALGYSLAQNLFLGKQNLLVEGVADLAYLQTVSAVLENAGRTSLHEGITLTPVGGLKKVSAFVSLFGANDLEIVVLHDFEGKDDPQLQKVIQEKLLKPKHILHYGLYRGGSSVPTDVEDLFNPALYLTYFKKAYAGELKGQDVKVGDLPAGDRIVDRLNRFLATEKIVLKASGGFNHYLPARAFASDPPKKLDAAVMDRFEALFEAVNRLLPP